jgi:hypothetical protein
MVAGRHAKTRRIFRQIAETQPERLAEDQVKFLFFTEVCKKESERNLIGLEAFFLKALSIAQQSQDPRAVASPYSYLIAIDVVRQTPDALKQRFGTVYTFFRDESVESIRIMQLVFQLISLLPQSQAALSRLYDALPDDVHHCLANSIRAAAALEAGDKDLFFFDMEELHFAQRRRSQNRFQALESMVEGHFLLLKKEPDLKSALKMYKDAKSLLFISETYYKILQVVCLEGMGNDELANHVLQQVIRGLDENNPASLCCEVPLTGFLYFIGSMLVLDKTSQIMNVMSLLIRHGRGVEESFYVVSQYWNQPNDEPRWRVLLEQLVEHNSSEPMVIAACATAQKNHGALDAAEKTLARGCTAHTKNILLHRDRALLAVVCDPGGSQTTRSFLYKAMELDPSNRSLRQIYDSMFTKQRDATEKSAGPAARIQPPSFPKVQYWHQGEWLQGILKGVSWSGQNVVESSGLRAEKYAVWTWDLRYFSRPPAFPGGFFETTPVAWRKHLPSEVDEYIANRLKSELNGFKPGDMLKHLHVESRKGILLVGGLIRDGIGKKYKENNFPKSYFDFPGDVDVVTTLQPETVEFFCKTFAFKDRGGQTVSPTLSAHRNSKYYGATSCQDIDFLTVRRSGMYAPKQRVRGSYVAVFPLVFGNCGYDLLTDAQARPFCCDAIYYDISSRTAIDPTGYGVLDASTLELRVTSDLYLLKNPEYIWRYLVRRACGYWGSEETKEKMRRSALHFWGEAHQAEHPTQLRWYYQKYTKTSNSGRSLSGQQFVRILKDDGMGDLAAQVMQPLCDSPSGDVQAA